MGLLYIFLDALKSTLHFLVVTFGTPLSLVALVLALLIIRNLWARLAEPVALAAILIVAFVSEAIAHGDS